MDHKQIFEKLWKEYSETNPGAKQIHAILEGHGEKIINDHVAFRTYDIPGIDIEALSSPFMKAGYVEKGEYFFESKRLKAKHFEHSADPLAPKVFISELISSDFSEVVQRAASLIAGQTLEAVKNTDELIFALTPWGETSYYTYKKLLEESEYAAWMYVWGFRANHFTIFINYLEKFTTIESLNEFLKESGYSLNNSGGEIKGTREQLLKQSSTLADMVELDFAEGTFSIPCCYYEFAERFEESRDKLYTGFIASSADKIFESTDAR
jgi:hypothetical protein